MVEGKSSLNFGSDVKNGKEKQTTVGLGYELIIEKVLIVLQTLVWLVQNITPDGRTG